MANKDITETGVRSVLETMGIPSSFQGLKENAIGRVETAATIGSSIAGTMVGMGGGVFEAARGGGMQAQLDRYRQIQEAMTYMPRTQGGLERVQQIGEFFEPVGQLYEQYGESVGEATGSPLAGEYAEEFLDPLFFLGGIGAIPKRASRIADAAEGATKVARQADPTIQVDLGIPEARLDEIAEQSIRAYHGSGADFDRFDLDFIGTGEGAQAYGYGLYFAEAEDVARGYKEALSEPRVLLDNKPLGDVYTADIREGFKGFYNGIVDRKIEEYADMFADAARDAGLDDADAYGAALNYLEASKAQILQAGSDKTIDAKAADALMKIKDEFSEVGLDSQLYFDLEDTINDIDSIIANLGQGGGNKSDFDYILNNYLEPRQKALYEEYFADKIKFDEPEGAMYEVNIKASKDELLDWDKPFSEQPKKVQEAITKILPQKQTSFESMGKEDLRGLLQRIDPNGVYSDEASLREFGELPTKQDFLDSIEAMEENDPGSVTSYLTEGITPDQSGRTIYERLVTRLGGGDRLDNRNKPSAIASERLNELGIKGIRYDDGLSRGKEGGTSNFVIFDPRIIDIAKKYGVAIPVAGAILMQSEGEQTAPPEA